jgi:hypothetical protein
LAAAVAAPAVGLDDESLVGEYEVDFDAGDRLVDERPRQPIVVAKREEALLELAAREGCAGGVLGDGRSQPGRSVVARVGSRHGIESGIVGEAQDLRLIERTMEAASRQRGCEFEQGAGRGVTGMPWWLAISSGRSVGWRWIRSPGRRRPPAARTMTSIAIASLW